MSAERLEIDRRTIELSNLDKLFFPDEGITKGDLVDYYRRVAETMLPHLESRPLSLQRFPEQIDLRPGSCGARF